MTMQEISDRFFNGQPFAVADLPEEKQEELRPEIEEALKLAWR